MNTRAGGGSWAAATVHGSQRLPAASGGAAGANTAGAFELPSLGEAYAPGAAQESRQARRERSQRSQTQTPVAADASTCAPSPLLRAAPQAQHGPAHPSHPSRNASSLDAVPLFDAYVVLDFEATCEKDVRLDVQEIIEFPMVMVDPETLTTVAEFQRYVRPVHHPRLSDFCVSLTGITQDVVDKAKPFADVFREALDWLASAGFGDRRNVDRSYCLVTCGDWDLVSMLPRQMRLEENNKKSSASVPPLPASFQQWVNVKTLFPMLVTGTRRVGGMEDMLRLIHAPLNGRHHSGIDDCRNIATILIELLKRKRCIAPTKALLEGYAPWRLASSPVFPVSSIVAAKDAPVPSHFDPAVVQPQKQKQGDPPAAAAADQSNHLAALDALLQMPPPTKHRPPNPQEVTKLSRKLTLVLRHRAAELHLNIDANGLVRVDDLMKLPMFQHLDHVTLGGIVVDCPKQRFRLAMDSSGNLFIGANQGHTMEGIDADLKPIREAKECPVAVHGTYYAAWEKIVASGGLSRMERLHVHFAKGLPGQAGVISGMRSSAQVLAYLNVAKCLADGLPLFESNNGVILSPGVGDTGMIPLSYLEKVVDAKTGAILYPKGREASR